MLERYPLKFGAEIRSAAKQLDRVQFGLVLKESSFPSMPSDEHVEG